MTELEKYRDQIDAIDRDIVRLFHERMQVVEKVADYKIKSGKSVFDSQREQQKIRTLGKLCENDFEKRAVVEIFEQIMAISRKKQYQLLTENGVTLPVDYASTEKLHFQNARVVFQGVEGAYSFEAMKTFFDDSIETSHVSTWREAMDLVARHEMDFGVLPIENTTAGSVSDIYDLLLHYHNYIVGEQTIKIDHMLMALPGTRPEDIKTVYSHPQGLAQCAPWLDKNHPESAIASRSAAEYFGLQILQEGGMSAEKNSTRFIILSARRCFVKSARKISICFGLPHACGTLYNILSHFIFNGLNMFKIESRPIPDRPFEYRFFIDFEGNLADPAVKNALRGIQAEAVDLRLLGNY